MKHVLMFCEHLKLDNKIISMLGLGLAWMQVVCLPPMYTDNN